jgi:hypothetical protein
MTPSIFILIALTPVWLGLVYYGARKSWTAVGLVAVPGLAIMALAAITPIPPEGHMLAPDQLVHYILCRIAGVYMLLTSFLSGMSLLATYGVRRFREAAPSQEPQTPDKPDANQSNA